MTLDEFLSAERGRQVKLARRLGVASSTISDIRSGRSAPSLDLAIRIEDATGGQVTARELAGPPIDPAPADEDWAKPALTGEAA